jgi:hypothetical protein
VFKFVIVFLPRRRRFLSSTTNASWRLILLLNTEGLEIGNVGDFVMVLCTNGCGVSYHPILRGEKADQDKVRDQKLFRLL